MEEADFKRLLEANAAETRAYFDVVATQLRQELRQELRQDIVASADGLRQELRGEIVASREEMRAQFEAMTERLESKIELVAEGVAVVNEKLDRETADIRAELRQGFSDTHDLIRFAYQDLDRRTR